MGYRTSTEARRRWLTQPNAAEHIARNRPTRWTHLARCSASEVPQFPTSGAFADRLLADAPRRRGHDTVAARHPSLCNAPPCLPSASRHQIRLPVALLTSCMASPAGGTLHLQLLEISRLLCALCNLNADQLYLSWPIWTEIQHLCASFVNFRVVAPATRGVALQILSGTTFFPGQQ